MTNRLIVKNNFCFLNKLKNDFSEIIFAPDVHSEVQKKIFQNRYDHLKDHFNIKYPTELEIKPEDILLGLDSFNEQRDFKQIVNEQNRLFFDLDFNIPEGFTPFKKRVEALLPDYYPDAINPIDLEVLKELRYYFKEKKLALTYFKTRNQMVGRDFSTKFSKYLACGALDVRFLYNQVKDFEKENEANKSTYWIIFELLWREFFYWHYQKHQNRYFSQNGLGGKLNFKDFKQYSIEELKDMTKDLFFHSALNELTQTGFQSNRVRQMFASFWLNDLKLNWRSGAFLFEQYLIDFDVYSNYGNWMYLAGVGVDPRGQRYFKIEKQLNQYDPNGEYIKKWYQV